LATVAQIVLIFGDTEIFDKIFLNTEVLTSEVKKINDI
jgi:hypothetical protein